MGFLAKKRSGANWDAFFVKQRGSGGGGAWRACAVLRTWRNVWTIYSAITKTLTYVKYAATLCFAGKVVFNLKRMSLKPF